MLQYDVRNNQLHFKCNLLSFANSHECSHQHSLVVSCHSVLYLFRCWHICTVLLWQLLQIIHISFHITNNLVLNPTKKFITLFLIVMKVVNAKASVNIALVAMFMWSAEHTPYHQPDTLPVTPLFVWVTTLFVKYCRCGTYSDTL